MVRLFRTLAVQTHNWLTPDSVFFSEHFKNNVRFSVARLRHDSEHSSSSVNDTKLGDPGLCYPAIKTTKTGAGDADDARTSPVSLCKRRVFTVLVGLTRMRSSLLGVVEVGCHYNKSRDVLVRLAPSRQAM